jgi:hypothetical protein
MKDCMDMRTCEGCRYYDGETCNDPEAAEVAESEARAIVRAMALLCFGGCILIAILSAVLP